MARSTTKIEIPINRVEDFIELCERISEKNEQLDASSPLPDDLMNEFNDKLSEIINLRKSAKSKRSLAQSKFGSSRTRLGFSSQQNISTPGTLYNLLTKVRDTLDIVNRQNPEASSEWGFDVVVTEVNGRTRVAYNIPVGNHDAFLDLADSIWDKHVADDVNSPLNGLDMNTFDELRQSAREDRDAAKDADAEAQSQFGEADVLLGRAEGQNSRTPGTLYYMVLEVRDRLKIINDQNPEALSVWGFNVVTGQAARRKARAEAQFVVKSAEEGNPPVANAIIFDQLNGEELGLTDSQGMLTVDLLSVGPNSFEITAEGFVPKVIQRTLQEGMNTLEALIEPLES